MAKVDQNEPIPTLLLLERSCILISSWYLHMLLTAESHMVSPDDRRQGGFPMTGPPNVAIIAAAFVVGSLFEYLPVSRAH